MKTRTINGLQATTFPLENPNLPVMWVGVLEDAGRVVTETDPLDSKADVFAALEVVAHEQKKSGIFAK